MHPKIKFTDSDHRNKRSTINYESKIQQKDKGSKERWKQPDTWALIFANINEI